MAIETDRVPQRKPTGFQVSLRELLALVFVAAVGVASLRLGGVAAGCFLLFAILLCMAMAVTVFVDRGARQAFAIGFVVCVVIYAAVVQYSRGNELDPYEGKLPTSKLLLPAFNTMATKTWHDSFTGQELPNYDPAQAPKTTNSGIFISGLAPQAYILENPDRTTFMSTGHVLWALIFGYVGAKFANLIHQRRIGNE